MTAGQLKPARTGNTLLLFGSQALSFNIAAFEDLWATLQRVPDEQRWITDAVASFPDCWADFVGAFPKYDVLGAQGQDLLQDMHSWFRTGSMKGAAVIPGPGSTKSNLKLPNIVLSPLVVITHLVEYLTYSDATDLDGESLLGTLGFCTGVLSAFSVALSKDRGAVRNHGATALRLAMLIGGVVDAQEILDPSGPATALATAWGSSSVTGEEDLQRILDQSPFESYISVEYDENRSTVTTASKTADALQHDLRAAGIIASEIGLRGRFHDPSISEEVESIIKYCDANEALRLPDASELVHPTWCSMPSSKLSGGGRNKDSSVTRGSLHGHAMRTILVHKSDWHRRFETAWRSCSDPENFRVISFGPERSVPPSFMRKLGPSQAISFSDFSRQQESLKKPAKPLENGKVRPRIEEDVAVIGMSIKVAGADDVDEFWDLLCQGTSQQQEVPEDRVSFDNVWRERDASRKWYGNFIDGHDAFDLKFFKKSAREIASTDPQQRHMLQVAYQAVEQSGYFGFDGLDDKTKRKVGCFIGVCSADYENNVACYQPNAFTAIGNLKSFIAGKISHWFGWLGPSLCIDSACSSSLVAVHQACQAVLSGECTSALAGGANIITNSLWFQNLAAASFLSPTGQCKPFDEKADGYCRGEGFAAVMVKRMSDALRDGDQILGTISATAVYQNQNCTPVFVPNAPSLSELFQDVVEKAQLEPRQITVVEAHGTGTQVGDPAEYASMKAILGGPATGRTSPLALGSVKGLIGHTECASGAVSLVKTLLMTHHRMIPPQASFDTMNPAIEARPSDKMEIVSKLKPWAPDADICAALINNYGASGSNASAIVTEAPRREVEDGAWSSGTELSQADIDQPLRLFGTDERALRAYCSRLARFLTTAITSDNRKTSLSAANLAFNISRQCNPTLDKSLVFNFRSVDQLIQKLSAFDKTGSGDGMTLISASQQPARPVILCFGGQVSTFVGLDRSVYESSKVLRVYLDKCDEVCKSIPGAGTIFPHIFQRASLDCPVKLQSCLFAMQYACAMSWVGSGIKPAAVVGHSFGELVALCVSGILSLTDALTMVVSRAKVIRESWGPEKGAMVAVEGDLTDVQDLLAESGNKATIACFNGPRSFTLAGTTSEIDAVAACLKKPEFSSLRSKRLDVTNAFHSTLVEKLLPQLVEIGRKLKFNEPKIPFERATKTRESAAARLTAEYVGQHMRQPVYFDQAINRLSQQYPAGCIFLEAGSNSTVTGMVSRALGSPKASHFQSVNITSENGNGRQALVKATLDLWKAGLRTTFWPHHRVQTQEYAPVILPPYQFEKSRHWMEMKAPPKTVAADPSMAAQGSGLEAPPQLFSFLRHQDEKTRRSPIFQINTHTEAYKTYVNGHMIAKTAPICPATLIIDMVIEALTSVRPELSPTRRDWLPQIHGVSNQAPICLDDSRSVTLDFKATDPECTIWDWRISSSSNSGTDMLHVTGQLVFVKSDSASAQSEFKRYERLAGGHRHCAEVLSATDADDIIHGARNIYRTFSEVVDYAPPYRGLQRLVGKGNQSAGRVVMKPSAETWLGAHLSDSFSQVGGIFVNCMTDCDPGDMYIAVGFEKWARSGAIGKEYVRPDTWDVLVQHEKVSDKVYLSDIFIFDSEKGQLVEVILGVNYSRVSKASMGKTLARLTPGLSVPSSTAISQQPPQSSMLEVSAVANATGSTEKSGPSVPGMKESKEPSIDVTGTIRLILADISGLEPAEIKDDAALADIGIDSLMGMELGREMEGAFKTPLMGDELASVLTFNELVACVSRLLGVTSEEEVETEISGTIDTESESSLPTSSAPTPVEMEPEDVKAPEAQGELHLLPLTVFEAFEETKSLTDDFIAEYGCADYIKTALPRMTQLPIALAVEALAHLGCDLKSAKAGAKLQRISHAPQHARLVEWLYKMLGEEARLVDISPSTGAITRTSLLAPAKPSATILADLLKAFPEHASVNRLTYFAGSHLADVLRGDQDGIKLIFGTEEGRDLVTGLYGDSLLNNLANAQMRDMLTRLIAKLKPLDGPLKIMELGAGTGGTTKDMVPMLAEQGVPIEYTFTDLSGSFVAAARKKFGPKYPFMKFRVHDIEKEPSPELGQHHIIISSNAIHATHNLQTSVGNIRKALRPDGFLMMLEMTQPLYWVDMIFGLFEGWWLFDDGRRHAIASQARWKADLQAVGYGRVDWTDGWRPEINIQRVIVAQATRQAGFPIEPTPMRFEPPPKAQDSTSETQEAQLDAYVHKYTKGFDMPVPLSTSSTAKVDSKLRDGTQTACVAITGATGSLGAHLVAHLAALSGVKRIFCLNRHSTTAEPVERQAAAFSSRGIEVSPEGRRKLQVLVADLAKPDLGLAPDTYRTLFQSVTHIVHNAWPMTGKRPVSGLETQFSVMRNMIDLARDAAVHRSRSAAPGGRVTFQLVSSIAVMGHHPLIPGNDRFAPEARASAEHLLPNGYAHAKWVCERMLDGTLHRYPLHFRASAVRPGQIAGNSASGYWNENEHLSFLIKSSQSLGVLPALQGDACWTPVEQVAGGMADLLLLDERQEMHPVYHIDNPVRQPWGSILSVLADELAIPPENVVPFGEWVHRVRTFPGSVDDNPAARLVDFLDDNFVRMSCGGMLLETKNSCEHSATMRSVRAVSQETVKRYLEWWKLKGFLHGSYALPE